MLSEVGNNKGPRSGSTGDNQSPGLGREGIIPRLLDLKGAARYLGGISPWTVRAMHWRGEIPAVRFGRRLLFDVRDLDALIEKAKRQEQS